MQFRQATRAELRASIGYLARRDKFVVGTVLASPAPTSTTFALEEAKKFSDGTFTGCVVFCVSGTGIGQSVFCEDSAAGTGVLTVTPALGTTFDATSRIEVWPDEITPEAVNNALDLAQGDLEDRLNIYTETATPTLDADRRVVTIPATYVKLCGIRYLDSGGLWRIYRYSHTPDLLSQEQGKDFTVMGRSIYLSEPVPSDIAGADIYVCGYILPPLMDSDSDLASCPAPFLVYKAAALLEQGLAGSSEIDSEGHANRGATWLAQAQQLRDSIPYTNFLPNTIQLDT